MKVVTTSFSANGGSDLLCAVRVYWINSTPANESETGVRSQEHSMLSRWALPFHSTTNLHLGESVRIPTQPFRVFTFNPSWLLGHQLRCMHGFCVLFFTKWFATCRGQG